MGMAVTGAVKNEVLHIGSLFPLHVPKMMPMLGVLL